MSVTSTRKITRITTGVILYSKLVCKICVFIFKYKPSVLHITTSATLGLIKDIIIIWLGKLTKTPLIFHWRFGRIPDLSKKNNWEWILLKYVVQNSTESIVIDRKSYDTLFKFGFTNIINIPNPIPFDIEKRAEIQLKINSERVLGRIIFVGHVIPDKGVFELVEACIDIPEINELFLIGPYEEDIKKKLMFISQMRNDATWLKFSGSKSKEQVLEYMRSSMILVLPSYTEGFPNVIIEAMAMGCAVVATDVGAIPEMIDACHEKSCGICIPVRNIEKLKEAIFYLINHPEKANEMGQNGIEKTLKNYTMKTIVEQYVRLWNNVSKKHISQ